MRDKKFELILDKLKLVNEANSFSEEELIKMTEELYNDLSLDLARDQYKNSMLGNLNQAYNNFTVTLKEGYTTHTDLHNIKSKIEELLK